MSSRIYTKTGDRGETGLFGGQRLPKDDLRVEAYGATDELNASIGVALAHCSPADSELAALLLSIQEELFDLGSDLATPALEDTNRGRITIHRIDSANVERLEAQIDRWEAELAPLRNFILPGGHPVAAALHLSRTVCRRAERRCVTLARTEGPGGQPAVSEFVLTYFNRLSDLLFVLSRVANSLHDVADVPWNPGSREALR